VRYLAVMYASAFACDPHRLHHSKDGPPPRVVGKRTNDELAQREREHEGT
jgi:hypothetical protein